MNSKAIAKKLPISERFRVFANGTEYTVTKGHDCDFVHLITTDVLSVEVVVTDTEITRVDLRPSRRKKPCTVEGGSLKFALARGDYYCLEINGDLSRPLLLFCDEKIEKQLYFGQNLIYFQKNTYYKTDLFPASDTVIFIDEGAVVEGRIFAKGIKNLRILGNGILNGQNHENGRFIPIDIQESDSIEINGITILGLNAWNLRTQCSKNILIQNVKIMAHMVWSDGIDVVSCENVTVRHIFVKNEDDCICVKTAKDGDNPVPDVRNLLVEDCVLWSGPRGNSLEIGYGTNNATVEHILFRNVDVLHRMTQETKFHRSVISIHNAGNAVIRDVTYENVYAEESDENFIQISHMHQPKWGVGDGVIENICLRNVTLAGGKPCPSAIRAYPCGIPKEQKKPCVTRNITLEGISYLGRKIKNADDARECGFVIDEFAENVRFL